MSNIARTAKEIRLSNVKIDQSLCRTTLDPILFYSKHPVEFVTIVLKAPVNGLDSQLGKLPRQCQHERIIVHLTGQTSDKSYGNQLTPPLIVAGHQNGYFHVVGPSERNQSPKNRS